MATLKTYRQRRRLKKTKPSAEPYGRIKKSKSKEPLFVIQKHDASHLHYDFRLEIEGVLASWAVPKGLPTKSAERRLALPTDDHPMEYAQFEGIIPQGHYGGGTVMVWDIGTYINLREKKDGSSMKEAKKEGTIEVFLKGKKLWGAYALVKTKGMSNKESWIVLKMKNASIALKKSTVKKVKKDVSALTGRTLKQIATDKDAVWE